MRVWIYHLALNCLKGKNYIKESVFIGEDGRVVYAPVKESEAILLNLLKKYEQGLSTPLHFYPETSWAYAYAVLGKNKTEAEGLNKAREQWEGSKYNRGEGRDPYYQLCLGRMDPLDNEFKKTAREIFEPLLKAR